MTDTRLEGDPRPPASRRAVTDRPSSTRGWRRVVIALGIALVLTGIAAALPRDNAAEGWTADRMIAARMALFGTEPLDSSNVLVVGVDTRSLNAEELAPIPRVMFSPIYADLVTSALEHGARGVILDFVLAYDPAALSVGGERPLRRYDLAFLRLLRTESASGRLVLGTKGALTPAKRFVGAAKGQGLGEVDVPIGAGNVIREVPPFLKTTEGARQLTLSGHGRALLGDMRPDPVLMLPPAPLDTLPSVSLIDLMRCKDSAALQNVFSDRVVVVGSMVPGEDRLKFADRLIGQGSAPSVTPKDPCTFPRPFTRAAGAESLPGVYAHAGAVDGAVSGWAPRPVDDRARMVLVFAFALIAALIALKSAPAFGAGLIALLALGGFGLGTWMLTQGVFLPSAGPPLAAVLGFGLTWGVRLGLLDRQANRTRRAFGRYLSPVLVNRMIETGETPELGGEPRDVSVLFADLSGFTATSEKMKSDELTTLVNRYLDRIDRVIQANGGYVDKFIGDAVMAIFNAPASIDRHAKASVDAAHQILHVVEEEAVKDRARGLPGFKIKVGISSGPATVGNVGSQDRLNYTVIGDTVNQAARFESLPGLFKTPIVIGPETASRIEDVYELLPIVSIQVKGKSDGLRVFAPMALKGTLEGDTMGRLSDYAIALQAFEEGSFETAAMLWDDLSLQDWPGAEMAGALADEARYLIHIPPTGEWTGVLEARSK